MATRRVIRHQKRINKMSSRWLGETANNPHRSGVPRMPQIKFQSRIGPRRFLPLERHLPAFPFSLRLLRQTSEMVCYRLAKWIATCERTIAFYRFKAGMGKLVPQECLVKFYSNRKQVVYVIRWKNRITFILFVFFACVINLGY